jgi:hypothetical protein
MTITIRRSTAAVLIALVGVLGGLAISNVSDAFSSNPPAAASYASAPFEKTLTRIERQLGEISDAVGHSAGIYNILAEVEKIQSNTAGSRFRATQGR